MGGVTTKTVEVDILQLVWYTAMEVTRYPPKTKLLARFGAYKVRNSEEHFQL